MLFSFTTLTIPHLNMETFAKTGEMCGNTENIGNLPRKDGWNPADPNPTLAWHEGARNIVLWSGERLIFAELLVWGVQILVMSAGPQWKKTSGWLLWQLHMIFTENFTWPRFWKCFYHSGWILKTAAPQEKSSINVATYAQHSCGYQWTRKRL